MTYKRDTNPTVTGFKYLIENFKIGLNKHSEWEQEARKIMNDPEKTFILFQTEKVTAIKGKEEYKDFRFDLSSLYFIPDGDAPDPFTCFLRPDDGGHFYFPEVPDSGGEFKKTSLA